MNARGIIFDLDGTLVDSLRDIVEAMNRVLTEAGLPTHDADAYRYFIGDGARSLVRRALPDAERGRWKERLVRFKEIYASALLVHSRPYEDIPELLAGLVERGVPLCILSNKPHGMTVRVVDATFDGVPFVSVRGARHSVPRKPDPGVARTQAQAMRLEPAQIILVGDTGSDMETAIAAGMRPFGVAWGFRKEEELRDCGAELVLRRPLDLFAYVSVAG